MVAKRIRVERQFPNVRVGATRILADIRRSRSNKAINSHALLPAYVASVCAAVEHRMNNAYVRHLHEKIGPKYGAYATPFLRFGVEAKLGHLFPLLTNFKYELNRDAPKVKALFRIYRLRNRLIHQIPHLVEADFEVHDGGYASMYFVQPDLEYGHAHEEWWSVTRGDLRHIESVIQFWMVYLSNIEYRIGRRNFNPGSVLTLMRT
jgi:hypothetical protein